MKTFLCPLGKCLEAGNERPLSFFLAYMMNLNMRHALSKFRHGQDKENFVVQLLKKYSSIISQVSPNKKTKIKNEEKMTKRKFTQFLAPFFIFVLYKKVGIHIWLR